MDHKFNIENIKKEKKSQELMEELANLKIRKDELEKMGDNFDEPNNSFELEKIQENIVQVEKDIERRIGSN